MTTFSNKILLITGGTGSFGNAVLCVMIGAHLLWRELVLGIAEWPAARSEASGLLQLI